MFRWKYTWLICYYPIRASSIFRCFLLLTYFFINLQLKYSYIVLFKSRQKWGKMLLFLEVYSNVSPSFLQIDHSIIESFGGEGKICITAIVYPKLAIGNESHVYVFDNRTVRIRISSTVLGEWRELKSTQSRLCLDKRMLHNGVRFRLLFNDYHTYARM